MTDLLLLNAVVLTMDEDRPRAQEVAIKDGRILAVGEEDDLKALVSNSTEVIDLGGKTILPGFIDAHLHLRALAESLVTTNIGPASGVSSISHIQERVRHQALKLPPGTWIRAGGYNEIYLSEKRDPNRWDLDAAAPHHPVKLTHRSGHAHVLNSLGLTNIGISKETPDSDAGLLDRDLETGEPTGLLYGMGDFLSQVVPPLDVSQLDRGVKLANQELLSSGITTFQDASSRNDIERWRSFENWKREGTLQCRVLMMLGFKGFEEYQAGRLTSQMDKSHLRLGGVKIVLDETTGRLNPRQEDLNEIVLSVHQAGQQVAIHAIEETAIEAACSALERAIRISPRVDHRHRIEHCSVCPSDLADRIASLGIAVVTNPAFLYASGERYLKTVPPRQLKHLYPLSTLIQNGVQVAAGSDAPVAPVNPLAGIYAAVSRKAESGEVVLANEKITSYEALRMYTMLAARSSFDENLKGTIAPGKLADLTILSADPTSVPTEAIKEIRVEMTIVGGDVIYRH
jgi:predicted amidohydrolase YtcJ